MFYIDKLITKIHIEKIMVGNTEKEKVGWGVKELALLDIKMCYKSRS